MDGDARKPKAEGGLFETPFCHLALYLYRHAQTGTIQLNAPGLSAALVRFHRGRPTAMRPSPGGGCRLLEALLPLCALREGSFAFYDADVLGEAADMVSGVVDPYELLGASLEQHTRDDMVEALLKRFAGQPLRMLPKRDIERLRLKPAYKSFLDLIRAAPAPPEELLAQTELPQPTARRVLYALIASHMVSSHEQREPDTYRSQPAPGFSRPPATGADGLPAWQRLASLRPGVSLRPNGAPATPLVSLVPASAKVPSLTPVSLAPAQEDRAGRIRRTEQLLQRGRVDEALAETDALLAEGKADVELLALHAQVLFEKHSVDDAGLPRAVHDAIKRAIDADPDHPRTTYIKGLVAKRAGDTRKALAYFRKVLQSDPKHIDAQREVRLLKLRADGM